MENKKKTKCAIILKRTVPTNKIVWTNTSFELQHPLFILIVLVIFVVFQKYQNIDCLAV
uniref:Uncharacterized protein n=1 Tax=Heterorhabditis bacteriophora TaxID=37862 RepID=A0A1I7WF72_HETBA